MVSTTARIPKVTVADVELDDWTLPDEAITDGNPVAKGKLLWQSDDKRLANGVWSCEPGSFNWEYTWDETIYFIEGEVVITDQGRHKRHLPRRRSLLRPHRHDDPLESRSPRPKSLPLPLRRPGDHLGGAGCMLEPH